MKQRQYTEKQKEIINILLRISKYVFEDDNLAKEIQKIKDEYDIKPPFLTIKEYINKKCCGAYHTFHFTINGKKIMCDSVSDFAYDEKLEVYLPLLKNYYVVDDKTKDNGGNCENYHCDHYLIIEPKED